VKCPLDSCTGALLNIQVEKTTCCILVIFILLCDKKNENYKQEKKKLKPRYMFKNSQISICIINYARNKHENNCRLVFIY